jgi:lipoprotein-anchoring transpeptidase ErfK/SrfK
MKRAFLALLVVVFASTASAGTSPRMRGDPVIDAQWAQLKRAPAAAPGRRQAAQPPVRREIDPAFLPAIVDYPSRERPGTIVIDTRSRYLYLVLESGKAQRYGVGVGREGFGWSGTTKIGRKAEWPTWTPPPEMRKRQPYLPVSMPGGPDNPLGARALYLHQGGRDTLFRIHGSNEPWTIGQAVSSGCFRMRNEDVVELYGRVGIGTKVVVL